MRPGNKVTKINDTTYVVEEFFGMVYGYIVIGSERAAVIDTGFGYFDYGKVVPELTDKPVDVLLTHGHLDHIGSNHRFERVYMHPADEEVYRQHADRDIRLDYLQGLLREVKCPERLVTSKRMVRFLDHVADIPQCDNRLPLAEGDVFDLGGRRLEVIETPGHTPGSVVFLDIDNRELYSGDTVCDEGIILHFDHSCSVETFRDSIVHLKEHADRFDIMWPGHHKKPIDKSFLEKYIACAEKIMAEHRRDEDPANALQAVEYDGIQISFTADKL